jgi:hypothetical protein
MDSATINSNRDSTSTTPSSSSTPVQPDLPDSNFIDERFRELVNEPTKVVELHELDAIKRLTEGLKASIEGLRASLDTIRRQVTVLDEVVEIVVSNVFSCTSSCRGC